MVTNSGASIRVDPWTCKQVSQGGNNKIMAADKIGIEDTLCCALNRKSAHFLSTFDFTQKRLAFRYKLRHLQWGVN